jgi:hypothetical protein
MAKLVSESTWKAFVKKQKLPVELEDKELLKALVRLDKTDERKPEPRLEALKELAREIPKQVTALAKLKKQLGDKPFGLVKDELYAVLEEVESQQKKLQAALDAESEDDDEDSKPNALLNPKLLLKQLNLCRKDPERTMKFAFVDAKDKQPAVMALHPRMGARALFTRLQTAAGVKTGAYGSAWVDGMSLMLQLDKPLSGLVKKVRAPVKACGFRITKAVLWNEDGTVFEQDDEPEDVTAETSESLSSKPPPTTAPPKSEGPPPLDAGLAFKARLSALLPRLKQAQTDGHHSAPEARLKASEAGVLAGKGNFTQAQALLDEAEALLERPSATPTKVEASTNEPPDAQLGDALALWKARREAAVNTLKDVARQIAAARHPSSAKAIVEIQAVVKNLTAEPRSLQQVRELQTWLAKDDVVHDVCTLAQDIRTPLLGALDKLLSELAA